MKAIQFPFQLGADGKVAGTADVAQIVRGQVIDALMTNLGERVFRPRYGCDIQAALFDPIDELERRDAASRIKSRLEQLVTRAIIRAVTLEGNTPEPGAVLVTIVYRPSLYSTDTSIAVPLASEFLTRQQLTAGATDA
jgi:phage baseplate assembly protein W